MGSVKKIRTRSTIVQSFDESELVLPNSELLAKRITNWTLTNHRARAIIPIGVAYGSNVELVRSTLQEVAAAHPRMAEEPQVFFTAFGDNALEFRLMLWVDVREKLQVVSDVLFAIEKAFREKSIEIPFPQSVVHLRTSSE
jgi:small-conductance mechanosensitive channel